MSWKTRSALFSFVVLFLFAERAHAQDMDLTAEETQEGAAATDETTPGEGEGAGEEKTGAGTLDELAAKGEDLEAKEVDTEEVGQPKTKIEIYALQRIWAKKAGRFELFPSFGTSMADPYVRHLQFALSANYYVTEVLGVGIHGGYFGNTTSGNSMNTVRDLNYHVSRSFGLVIPINEYAGHLNINFTYVFLYGKFSAFRKYIFNWDAYLAGGLGVIWTRPIPVVDVEYRTFKYTPKICINFPAIGIRIFLTRYIAIATELRLYMFPEKLENRDTRILEDPKLRADSSKWLESGSSFTFNWMWQFGLSFYFPFKVKYKYEK